MMRIAFALAMLLLGCRQQPQAPTAPETAAANEAAPLPDADLNASLGALGEDPPRPGAPRFVGRWAASERLCETAAWHFTEEALETPAGSVCRFGEVSEVPGGYDVEGRCTAESPERDDTIRLRFAESAGGMLVESDSIADAGLVRCGDRTEQD